MSLNFRLTTVFNKIEEGWMEKKGHVIKTWRKRYFSLDMEKKTLSYYGDEGKTIFKSTYVISPSSEVNLLQETDGYKHVLSLKGTSNGSESVLIMATETAEEKERWYEALCEAAMGVKINQPKLCEPFRNIHPLKIIFTHNDLQIDAHDGCSLGPQYSVNKPRVEYSGSPLTHYILIMVNPDSPAYLIAGEAGKAEPRRKSIFNSPHRDFVHWVVANIPANDVSAGHTVLPYVGACPSYNSGVQRYFFLIFKQDKVLSPEELEEAELHFSQRGGLQACVWASQQGFAYPLGINGFSSEWSDYCDQVHKEINFMPSADHRSPNQQLQYEAEEAEKKRIEESRKKQLKDAEIEAERLNQSAAALSLASQSDPILSFLSKYEITTREIFEGSWVNKKFSSEMMSRKRFVWIDCVQKRLYWSKVEGKEDPKVKSLDLSTEISSVKLNANNISCVFMQKELNGKNVVIQFISGDKEKAANELFKVANMMITTEP